MALLQRVAEQGRRVVRFTLDGRPVEALEGDTVLTAMLTNGDRLRRTEFADSPRAALIAASRAFAHRSAYPMLDDRSSRITSSRAPVPLTACCFRSKNGRANAATSSASATQRRISSRRCRIFCRRTERYGMRSRNMSDGNSTTTFRSRLIRWMMTGIAIAARPARKAGARKLIQRTRLNRCRAPR